MFWLLVPAFDRPSRGAWVELGVAVAESRRTIIASGDTRQSIFGVLAHLEFEEDVDALIEIVSRARVWRS